ncbi:MAG: hypothetical protein HQ546_05755, partial [Planctomycetes bacterium]|nr:hypothetical protein [Planctomycetota bacterium]
IYTVRPMLDGLETPDYSCNVEVAMGGDGDWLGNRPARPTSLTVEAIAGGKIRLRWQYSTPRGKLAPEDFAVYYGNSPEVDVSGSPAATVSYTSEGHYSTELTLTDHATYWLAVVARTGSGVASDAVTAGPAVADAMAPSTPNIYTDCTF